MSNRSAITSLIATDTQFAD